jgi:hypothetical protein
MIFDIDRFMGTLIISKDELRLKIDGALALELFDEPETPFIAAQWREALRDVQVTESFKAKKLVELLLRLRKSDHAELKNRLVGTDGEIERTEAAITQAETSMNNIVYRLYGLSGEEKRMVDAG